MTSHRGLRRSLLRACSWRQLCNLMAEVVATLGVQRLRGRPVVSPCRLSWATSGRSAPTPASECNVAVGRFVIFFKRVARIVRISFSVQLQALAARFQADSDFFVVPKFPCNRLERSPVVGVPAKLGLDATAPMDWGVEHTSLPEEAIQEAQSVLDSLE